LVIRNTRENHRPVASHRQTLSHNVVHLALIEIRTHNILVSILTIIQIYQYKSLSHEATLVKTNRHNPNSRSTEKPQILPVSPAPKMETEHLFL